MHFAIRSYHPSDLYALYQVCLRTADSGRDATLLYLDPDLPGQLYVAPYAVAEPDLCFVLTADAAPCGYVLGTRDSAAFARWCEIQWFPVLRTRYPLPALEDRSPTAKVIRKIHNGMDVDPALAAYPAHLHIDLLPIAQGRGWGRRLMAALLDRLRTLHAPGVHLGVGKRNAGAIQFYERMGFHRVIDADTWIAFGLALDEAAERNTSA